jgi:hypothetical protein
LLTFLLDLGLERGDGEVRYAIETDAQGCKRIVARFHFMRDCVVTSDGERFDFRAGANLRLFFSCRYTPTNLEPLLNRHGFAIQSRWITRSEEEGVWLCRKELK